MDALLTKSVLFFTIILLFTLIVASSRKLFIYFNTFMFLSKKQNYEKANYIANSSFIKYFYSNTFFYGYFNIELIFIIILCLLSLVAFGGYLYNNNVNYGYLNYYYGDIFEYTFVNSFIEVIIILTVIYLAIYIYWFTYYMIEDNKLKTNEKKLKDFITKNLSYDYLYKYYKAHKDTPDVYYTINNFAIESGNKTVADKTYVDPNFADNEAIFKLGFTNYILYDTKKFIYIKEAIINSIKEMGLNGTETENIEKLKNGLNGKLATTYIISNYNHNDNRALIPLDVMIDNLIINITIIPASEPLIVKLENVKAKIKAGNKDTDNIEGLYNECLTVFMETIRIYKEVYDKYSTYYMASLLITNFLLTYTVLIFIYIFVKILSQNENFEKFYNVYKFRTDLINYGIIILIAYYFISCPIIIFGFN